MKYSGIGGQAVLEGIMMMNRNTFAVAARRSDGGIEVRKDTYHSMTEKSKLLRLPFVRGVFRFADSMIVGTRALNFSAEVYGMEEEEGEEEPSRFEQFLDRVFGEKLEKIIMAAVMVFSFAAAIGIFMVLPLLLAGVFRKMTESETLIAFLEGLLRVLIFVTYIKLVSRMEDIRRTFMYHGGEHKCINCIEHGLPLTVENVRASSKEHKRCGTSFLLIVMMISILVFMVVRVDGIAARIISRIVLVPVIAGISYEVLQAAGRSSSKLSDIIAKPGLCMQALTTTEPDDSMIEVAIAATEAVFDWRAYLRDNFPDTVIPENISRPEIRVTDAADGPWKSEADEKESGPTEQEGDIRL